MKRVIKSIFVGFLLGVSCACGSPDLTGASEDVDKANKSYVEGKSKIRVAYRASIARSFSTATKVELYLLKFDQVFMACLQVDSPKVFKDVSGVSGVPILRSKVLTLNEQETLLKALQVQLKKVDARVLNSYNGTLHGIRVFKGNRKIFDSSFSWASMSYGVSYPDGYVRYETSDELKKVFYEILSPSPKDSKRYDQQYERE